MLRPYSEAPDLHLERARERVGSSRIAWCADYWQGGVPGPGGGGRGGFRSQINLPCRPKYMKTVKKRAVSRTFWPINHQKSRFSLKST